MHTPTGPRARPAAERLDAAAGGDAASARKPQEQARIEARQGGLNHGAARGDMPPKKKQRRNPVRRSRRLSGNSEAVGVQPETTVSQQAAADAVYHDYLQGLSKEELDFVRNDGNWPAIRTSTNKTGAPNDRPRKKGDWHSQRSAFVKQVFFTMHADSALDEDQLLEKLFDDGNYSFLKETTRVFDAVQQRYKGRTRTKAFTALSHLCEVKSGSYLAERCFNEEFKAAKMVYVDAAKDPDMTRPTDNTHLMALLGCVAVVFMVYAVSPGAAAALAVGYGAVSRARQLKDQAHLALDAGRFDEACSLMRSAQYLETNGFASDASDDEEPPPLLEDITNIATPASANGPKNKGVVLDVSVRLQIPPGDAWEDGRLRLDERYLIVEYTTGATPLVIWRDRVVSFEKSNAFVTINVNMICGRTQLIFDMVSTDVATTLIAILGKDHEGGLHDGERHEDDDENASAVDLSLQTDDSSTQGDTEVAHQLMELFNPAYVENYTDGCPKKLYAGRAPTSDERREWEHAATKYYAFLLQKYQGSIETLRLEVFDFLSQENLNLSKFVDRHNRMAKKTKLKAGLEATRAYFALATLYGDVGGSYEPERLDWYRAQFTENLPNPLPDRCMFVLVAEEQVTMVLRDGNKNGQNIDQDLTVKSPKFAEMLRLWMPHAASAQQDKTNPFVVFKHEQESYGTPYDESNAYGKMVKRAWKHVGVNPQEDANKEWAKEDKHGFGCDWARKVIGRARRGVVCKEGEKRDDMAAATQGHSASTERAKYRAM